MTDAPIRDGWPFSYVDRVRFGDLDSMRHLNNAVFLTFFESARIAYMGTLIEGHQADDPEQPGGFSVIFAECHINYRSPAFFDEDIRTWIRPSHIARSSFRTSFEMRSERDGRLIAEGYGVLVGYDYAAGRAAPLPDSWRTALLADAGPDADLAGAGSPSSGR